MLRRFLIASAATALLLVTTFHSDDAFARRGGVGVRAGAYHGGAVAARGYRGGAVAVRGGAYRGAYRAGAYRGYRYGAARGYPYGAGAAAVGAAALGAAAIGAAAAGGYYGGGYYGGNCGYDTYGNWVCPPY